MAITPADLPPEFAATDPVIAQLWIDAAAGAIDEAAWLCAGENPDTGCKLLASHYLKDNGEGTSEKTGAVTLAGKSVGGVSVSLKTGSAVDGPHGSSTYGRAYDGILKRVNGAPRCSFGGTPQPCL